MDAQLVEVDQQWFHECRVLGIDAKQCTVQIEPIGHVGSDLSLRECDVGVRGRDKSATRVDEDFHHGRRWRIENDLLVKHDPAVRREDILPDALAVDPEVKRRVEAGEP